MHELQGQDRDKLFELVKKCFLKDGPLGKVFNTNNLKISYKTLPNMKQTISAHNKKTTNKKKKNKQTDGNKKDKKQVHATAQRIHHTLAHWTDVA